MCFLSSEGSEPVGKRVQLAGVQAERNSLREDLISYRTSKRHADSSWRAERDRAERLEKELSFYQGQSARAMADRDKVQGAPVPPVQVFDSPRESPSCASSSSSIPSRAL